MDNSSGIGGIGGNGGAGGDGGTKSTPLILSVTTATLNLAAVVAADIADSADPFTWPRIAADVLSSAAAAVDEANQISALTAFDQSLASGQIGLGGSGGNGGNGGTGGDFNGGGTGGAGGTGGVGGKNWSGSTFQGGAAGGPGGNGGNGGLGGFGSGGGAGGSGGAGGAGATYTGSPPVPAADAVYQTISTPASFDLGYIDPVTGHFTNISTGLSSEGSTSGSTTLNNLTLQNGSIVASTGNSISADNGGNYTTSGGTVVTQYYVSVPAFTSNVVVTPAQPAIAGGSAGQAANGANGSGGAGGSGGLGGGTGASGFTPGGVIAGGSGGNAYGGAIFVRSGATLTIQGNALFGNNQLVAGQGQAGVAGSVVAGASGGTVGSDLFMMTGSTVTLDPGVGNIIQFNGNPAGSSIADDSASSITSNIPAGQGASLTVASGLVIFNGTDLYSGETKITGGVLQAQDTQGIYYASRINLAGGVLQSNGVFTRFVNGTSTGVEWTGSGGFAAQGGDLNVRLSNGQTQTWASGNFVPDGSALLFGSASADSNVIFNNKINLNGGTRTVLVTANAPLAATDPTATTLGNAEAAAVAANTDTATLLGALSNGALKVGDATHTGILILGAANTYTGGTTVNGGTLLLAPTGSLASTGTLTVDGSTAVFDLGADHATQVVGTVTLDNGGTINGTGVSALSTPASYELKSGTVNALLAGTGALNKTTGGTVTLSAANPFTGGTALSAGTLALNNSLALQNSTVSMLGGTLGFVGNLTIASLGGLAGSTGISLVNNTSAVVALTVGSNNATTAYSGTLSGGGSLTKNGTGSLSLTGTNTFTGPTTVNAGTMAISGGSALSDASPVTVHTAGTLAVNTSETIGSLSGDSGSSVALGSNVTLTVNDTDTTTFAGVISGATGSLTKIATGTLTLSGANTYGGLTLVTNGTLALGANNVLATSSRLTVNGGTFALNANQNTVSAVSLLSGNITGPGALTSTSDFDLQSGLVTATLSGTVGANKTTSGTVTLSGTNTYTGATIVTAGTLAESATGSISDASNLTVNGATAVFDLGANHSDTVATVTLDGGGLISGTGNSALTSTGSFEVKSGTVTAILAGTGIPLNKTTSGTVTLSGANTYTGNTTVTAGILRESATGSISDASNLIVNGATAVFDLGANHSDTVATVTLDGGGLISGTGNSALTSTGSFELKSGTVTAILAGTGIPLNKTTSGTVTLSGANTYTGNTTVTAGILTESATGSIADGSNLTVTGNTAVFDLGANHSDTVATVTLDGGGLISGTGNSALTSTGSFELKNGTVTAILAGAGIPLNKTTNATVTLSGANTYTGNTTVTAGTLRESATGSISDASNLTINGATAVFDLGANHSDTVATVTLDGGGLISGTGNSALTSTGSFELKSGTVTAILAGAGIPLNKTTSGTVTLSAANTYTGNTTVTAGTLRESTTGSISDASNLIVNGTTAVFDLGGNHSDTVATVTLDGGGLISGTGSSALTSTGSFELKSGTVTAILAGAGIPLNKTTSGTVTLSGANTYTGNTTVTAGTLAESATGSIADVSKLTVNGTTAVFDLGANHSDTVSTVTLDGGGLISGTGNSALTSTGSFELKSGTVTAILAGAGIPLNKTTGGTVTLSGANTYTGATNINAGTLVLSATGSLVPTQVVNVASGAGFTVNNASTIATLNSNGLIAGTALLTASTYNLNDGTRIDTSLGQGLLYSNGAVSINATLGSDSIFIQTGKMTLLQPDVLSHNSTVDISTGAKLELGNGDATILNLTGNGSVTLNDFVLHVANGGSYTGTLSSPGTLNKTGNGTLTLSGTTTFSTGTNVDSGPLVVDGNLTTTTVTISAGGTLMGHGTIIGDVIDNGGITSPGNSPGVLTIAGNYTENSILKIEIGGLAGPGVNPTGHDQVKVGGSTTLNPATSTLQIVKYTAFEPSRGDIFQIINGPIYSISGHFGAVTSTFTNDLIFILSTGNLVGTGLLNGQSLLSAVPNATANQQGMITGLQVADHQYAGGDLFQILLQPGANVAQVFNETSPEA